MARQQASRKRLRTSIETEQTLEQISVVIATISADSLLASASTQLSPEQCSTLSRSKDWKDPESQVEPVKVDGGAEAILRGVDPELLERVKSQSTKAETSEVPIEEKQKRAKQKEQQKRVKKRNQEMEM